VKILAGKSPWLVLAIWFGTGWLAWQIMNFAVRGLSQTWIWNILPSSLLGQQKPSAASLQTLDFLE